MKVYLCGGINGLSDGECNDWRSEAKATLHAEAIDPMRRDYRGQEDESVDAIVLGDLHDIRQCDAILVNATRPSWGTAMELVYAHQQGTRKRPGVGGKLIVAFVGGARVSPWLRFHSSHVVETLAEAVAIINGPDDRP